MCWRAAFVWGLLGTSAAPVSAAAFLWVDGSRPRCANSADPACCHDDVPRAAVTSAALESPAAGAWCSIERAVRDPELQPGDTIVVRAGIYLAGQTDSGTGYEPSTDFRDHCDMRPAIDGTADAPITLRNYPGELVTVDGRIPILGTWLPCSAPASDCPEALSEAARPNIWWLEYPWIDAPPYSDPGGGRGGYPGQFWTGTTFRPSVSSNDFAQLNGRAGYWAHDPARKRLYYRPPLDGQDPNVPDEPGGDGPNGIARYAGCSAFFSTDGHHGWTIDGLRFIGATGAALNIIADGSTGRHFSYDVRVRNTVVAYSGNNACTPTRDGSFGHAMYIQGGSARAGTITVEHNDFSESAAENVHVGSACDRVACGESFLDNAIHHSASDPGWNSQCADRDGRYGDERGLGLIVRSNGGLYEGNHVFANDGEGLALESDGTVHSEPPSAPSRVTLRKNVIVDNAGVGLIGGCHHPSRPSKGNRVYNNVLRGNATDGTRSGSLRLEGHCVGWRILNNSVAAVPPLVDQGNALVLVAGTCGGTCAPTGTLLVNNAFVTDDAAPAAVWCPTCRFARPPSFNLFFSASGDPVRVGSSPRALRQVGRRNLAAPPGWDADTLMPLDGSPLLGAGVNRTRVFRDNVQSQARARAPHAWNVGAW
jgi:hypothetical protein